MRKIFKSPIEYILNKKFPYSD